VTVCVHLEHPVPDYEAWKAAFDSDPLDRKASGVLAYRILRPVGGEGRVAVDLEFADRSTAERFRDALLRLWSSSGAVAVMRDPIVRVEVMAENRRL
jgi:streptomycin 6-kinase